MTTYPPSIHMNGSSKEDLIHPLQELIITLKKAGTQINECYPHIRDYYPQGEAAWDNYESARAEVRQIREHIGSAELTVIKRLLAILEGGYSATEKKDI